MLSALMMVFVRGGLLCSCFGAIERCLGQSVVPPTYLSQAVYQLPKIFITIFACQRNLRHVPLGILQFAYVDVDVSF